MENKPQLKPLDILRITNKSATLGNLTGGIAHEINNPVAYVSSNLYVLKKYFVKIQKLIEKQQEVISSVKTQSFETAQKKIEELDKYFEEEDFVSLMADIEELIPESAHGIEKIRNILASMTVFSRTSDDEVSRMNVNENLDVALQLAWNELKYKCQIRKSYSEVLPLLPTHIGQMQQAFLYVILFAGHIVEKNAFLDIETTLLNQKIVVRVGVSGVSLSNEDFSKILIGEVEKDALNDRLNLYIASKIVKSHQGDIRIELTPDKGSQIVIELPLQGGIS